MSTQLADPGSALGVSDTTARLEDVTNDPGVRVEVGEFIYFFYDVPPLLQLPDKAAAEALGTFGDIWEAVNIALGKGKLDGDPLILRFLPAVREKLAESGNLRPLWVIYNPVLGQVIACVEIAKTASPALPLAVYLVGLGVISVTLAVVAKVVTQWLELRTVQRLVTSEHVPDSQRAQILDSFRDRFKEGGGSVLGDIQGTAKTGVILVIAAVVLIVLVNVIPAIRGVR